MMNQPVVMGFCASALHASDALAHYPDILIAKSIAEIIGSA